MAGKARIVLFAKEHVIGASIVLLRVKPNTIVQSVR